jgi:hypothetical protein
MREKHAPVYGERKRFKLVLRRIGAGIGDAARRAESERSGREADH